MAKKTEIEELTLKLIGMGMKRDLATKNLLECDRYFIEKLNDMLKHRW